MDPLTIALLGSTALSGIGGFFGMQSQNSANSANMAFSEAQAQGAFLPGLVANAKKAGLNPLAVLGQTGSSAPAQVGVSDNPFSAMGQNLTRAASAVSSDRQKSNAMDLQLKQAQIDKTMAETSSLYASQAVGLGQPGTPPAVKAGSDASHPIMATAWYTDGKGRPFLGPSKEFADTQFGIGAWPSGIGMFAKTAGENVLQAGRSVWDDLPSIRPDIVRSNTAYSVPDVGVSP